MYIFFSTKGEVLNICTKHPDLIYSGISEFTPLGQVGTVFFLIF